MHSRRGIPWKGMVLFDFQAQGSTEKSVKAGKEVFVFSNNEGWSLVSETRDGRGTGYVPTQFIRQMLPPTEKSVKMGTNAPVIVCRRVDMVKSRRIIKEIALKMQMEQQRRRFRSFVYSGKFRQPIKRLKQIVEVITTEETYVEQLSQCIETFKNPLVEKGFIDEGQARVIFSNVVSIRDCSLMLLEELQRVRRDKTFKIAKCFKKISPFFKLYKTYVNNFDKSHAMMEKVMKRNTKLLKFLDQQKRSTKFNLSMKEFLLIPVLRVPRYKLLFDNILKYTVNESLENEELKQAHQIISTVALFVNESKLEDKKNAEFLELHKALKGRYDTLIQSFRRFQLKQKKGVKICCKEKGLNKFTSFDAYLFTDLLIFLEHESIFTRAPRAALLFLSFCEVYLDMENDRAIIVRCLSEGKIVHYQIKFSKEEVFMQWSEKIGANIIELQRKLRGKIGKFMETARQKEEFSLVDVGFTRAGELIVADKLAQAYEIDRKNLKEKEDLYEKLKREVKSIENSLNDMGEKIANSLEKQKVETEVVASLVLEKAEVREEVEKLTGTLEAEDDLFMKILSLEKNAFVEIFGENPLEIGDSEKQNQEFEAIEKHISGLAVPLIDENQ